MATVLTETTPATAETLTVNDLRVYFDTPRGPVKAVDGVNFTLHPGERFGLVGESGSGKSTIALALLRLIKPPGRIVSGQIHLGSDDILTIPESEIRATRMARLAFIPQGAMNSLNPVMRVKQQIIDAMRAHGEKGSKTELEERIGDLLVSVGLRRDVANRYPHELSGGMKQRVCIASGIALRPSVILADEPTSALDVVVQRQIMQTLVAIQQRLGASVLLIGHDMGLMAQFVDRIGVMYGGKLVEVGPTREIFRNPQHPYTQVLISSLPTFERGGEFVKIEGTPHSPLNPPSGCVFHPRCPYVMDICRKVEPLLKTTRPNHEVACHLYDDTQRASDTMVSGGKTK